MTRPATTARMTAHVRHWLSRLQPVSAPDAELLRRFVSDRDEAAFAALLDRHGPMVLGAACRVLGDEHTAEDVFQATFVTLARRAGHFRHPAALPAWLHRTACNLARTALRARRRRRRAEARAVARPAGDPLDEVSTRELLAILDEELGRLPEALRLPLVLCCLEGRSQEEAAALLGWTPGSVKGRLERGRQRLKARLAHRGLTLAVAGLPSLAGVLRQAALRAALGGVPLSPGVAALADGAFAARCRALLIVAVLGLVGLGAGWALLAGPKGTGEPAREEPASPRADAPWDRLPEGAAARLGSSRLRIGNSAFALTPDGRAIVTVSPEGVVRNLDAQTGRLLELRQITDRRDADPRWPCHVQLSADGRTAVIDERRGNGLPNPRVTVWDVPSGKLLLRPQPDKGRRLYWPALSPDGKQLAFLEAGDPDEAITLRVYDLKTGHSKELGGVASSVNGIRFSADGRRVVVSQTSRPGLRTGTFACFDVLAAKRLWRLPRKGGEYHFAVSSDGKTVAAAVSLGEGGFQVIETGADPGKPTERFQACPLANPHFRLVFAPDNRTLVMNHPTDGIVTWDLRAGKAGKALRPPPTRGPWGGGQRPDLGAISSDGRTVLTNLGHLQRWDLTTGKPFFDAPPDDGLGWSVERLAFTPDGKQVVASSFINWGRWEVATGKEVRFTRDRELMGFQQLVMTSDGLRALRCGAYGGPPQVTVYDPVGEKPARTVRWATQGGGGGLRACALTADGKTLLVAHGDEPKDPQKTCVTACDVASQRRLSQFAVEGNYFFEHSPFSPCGRWVVLGGKVYHVATGAALFAPGERLVPWDQWHMGPWFSPDGRLLAGRLSGKPDTLAVWELASGAVLARLPKAGRVAQVAFSADGRTVAILDGWGAEVHDLLTGKRLSAYPAPDVTCDLRGRGCGTQTLAFAPDGRTLATGHLDGTVLLWKVPQIAEGAKEIAERDREGLWADLGSDAPGKARAAVERLARQPAAAVTLLTSRFRPAPGDPALAALIKGLDSDLFRTREEATRKLREYGPKAESALRRELAATPSPEVRRRIEAVLAAVTPPPLRLPLAGDALRGVRAIEVLERAGTPPARQLLQGWAEQTQDVHLAAEARAALARHR